MTERHSGIRLCRSERNIAEMSAVRDRAIVSISRAKARAVLQFACNVRRTTSAPDNRVLLRVVQLRKILYLMSILDT